MSHPCLSLPQINLTTSPAAAQLISRAQSVNSAPSGISQQAVLLGNASSSTLTASQAQMYLRAQMVSPRVDPQASGCSQNCVLILAVSGGHRGIPVMDERIFIYIYHFTDHLVSKLFSIRCRRRALQNFILSGFVCIVDLFIYVYLFILLFNCIWGHFFG